MNANTIVTLILILAAASTSTVFAQQIYKWTDDEGNVYYSDMPTENAERVPIQSRPTDPAVVQDVQQAVTDFESAEAERKDAAAAQAQINEKKRAADRERQDNCAKYTERQFQFTRSRRIYRLDENGERVYYDEDEMATARAAVDDKVAEYCN